MKYTPISIPNNEAQFLETRKFQIEEIARLYRVPLHMIGDLDHATFSNIEEQSLEFVQYTLQPWLIRWEQSLQRALLTPDEKKDYFIRFNVDGLLRGNYATRMQGYATGINNGFMCPNDVRALENLDLIPEEEGGNTYLCNGNLIPVGLAGISMVASAVSTLEEEPPVEDTAQEQPSPDPPKSIKKQRRNAH